MYTLYSRIYEVYSTMFQICYTYSNIEESRLYIKTILKRKQHDVALKMHSQYISELVYTYNFANSPTCGSLLCLYECLHWFYPGMDNKVEWFFEEKNWTHVMF